MIKNCNLRTFLKLKGDDTLELHHGFSTILNTSQVVRNFASSLILVPLFTSSIISCLRAEDLLSLVFRKTKAATGGVLLKRHF